MEITILFFCLLKLIKITNYLLQHHIKERIDSILKLYFPDSLENSDLNVLK
jgi:hypothetical protein